MVWVGVFLGIALAGLVTAAAYAVWLWHKASDLFSELTELGHRAEELAELLGQIDFDRLSPAPASTTPAGRDPGARIAR